MEALLQERIVSLQDLMIAAGILTPFLNGIIAIARNWIADELEPRYIPIISVLAGVVLSLLLIQLSTLGFIVGLAVGLASTGLYELGKNTKQLLTK